MIVIRLIYSFFFIVSAFADDRPIDTITQLASEDQGNEVSNVIVIVPEAGKYKFIGNEIKSTIQIYLNNFLSNNSNLIFVSEDDENFIKLVKAYIEINPKISAFIGPVFSKSTRKLAEFLNEQGLEIKVFSLSNDSSLEEFSNVITFGFNTEGKVEKLVDEIIRKENEFSNIYLVYNQEGLVKDFGRYVREAFYRKTDKTLEVHQFHNVREFSRVLKAISLKVGQDKKSQIVGSDNQDFAPQKAAIIFINLGDEITLQLNNFLKKYNLSPEIYEFYFLSDVLTQAKFNTPYKKSIYVIDYDFSEYADFTRIFQENTGKKPLRISYSVLDILSTLHP